MPIISVSKALLTKALGHEYTDDEFDELCFAYGLELDDVTSEREQIEKEQGSKGAKAANASSEVLYKVEIPANRYDLLCLEGLARALNAFKNTGKTPRYQIVRPSGPLEQMTVEAPTKKIRPFIVAAVLRNVSFDQARYDSFVELQDKLHQNICRKRTLVAIGTHDLDTIKGPFRYTAAAPSKIKFRPLGQSKEFVASDLLEFYRTDPLCRHLKPYLHIIEKSDVFPVIYDSKNVVLSMPPIINGEHSKITLNTKNVFIECTATDLTKAKVVLDTVVTMFSEYCSQPFTVEPVTVTQTDGTKTEYPTLEYREETVSIDKINSVIGVDLGASDAADLLTRMSLTSRSSKDGKSISVTIPPTRHDVIHACDVIEDVAIAYGYNNIVKRLPKTHTTATQSPINKITDLLRSEVALAGYTEALTFSLCSIDDLSTKLQKEKLENAVHIGNPKTIEFQVVRTSLMPGMLKTIAANAHCPLPIRIFEIQDVVLSAPTEVGARNCRRLCVMHYGKTAGFEYVHGLLDRFMLVLSIAKSDYCLNEAASPTFFRGAEVVFQNKPIGYLGVLHPDVISAFDLTMPCSVLEVDIEPLLGIETNFKDMIDVLA